MPALLLLAFAVRAWSVTAGLPHAVGVDEPAIIDRALRMLNTGDWNPHTFDYPTLVIYVHALLAIVVFLGGAIGGAWSSLATIDIVAIYTWARLVTAAIGTLTVFLTYKIGDAIGGRVVGLLAAAQLAVLSPHVRESHYALTDVPVTALTTLAIWLSMRAAAVNTTGAYARAGLVCGLSAAAKYNGVVVCIAPAVAWLVHEWSAADRWRKAGAAAAAAIAAFVIAVPYAVLDLPAFLNGFAAQAARFTTARAVEPPWLVYLKHMALAGRFWLPLAALGLAVTLWRRSYRTPALPLLAFAAAYFYTLATHHIVFARYALPILPIVCLLAAIPVVETVRTLRRRSRPRLAAAVLTAASLAFLIAFGAQTVGWLRQFVASDTRQIAAEWMTANLPKRARIVVEISGPAYLTTRGFDVLPVEVIDREVQVYRDMQAQYLIVSSRDGERIRPYLEAGPIIYEIAPTAWRWGPPIRIVRLMP